MQKIVSAAAIAFSLTSGALASYASQDAAPRVLPTVASVLPDPLPLDMGAMPVYTAHETTIAVKAPDTRPTVETRSAVNVARANDALVWTCDPPRPLAMGSGTVRACAWVSR